MKLKRIVEMIQKEAALTGQSRSGGTSNWNHYVVRDFDPAREYFIENDAPMLDDGLTQNISSLPIGSIVTINNVTLKQKANQQFANVTDKATGMVGYVTLSAIRKPTTKGKSGAIGGTTSKEFLPDKLKLVGKNYEDKNALIADVILGMETTYGDDKYSEIRDYATECMYSITGEFSPLTEGFSKKYQLSKKYKISDVDVKILSKNFGEVLAALYIIATNKKAKEVFFPKGSSNPLYDFVMVKNTGMNEYYSVKSHGGSSTSMANLDFLLDHFSEDNALLDQYKDEIETVRLLINDKSAGKTTLTNIEKFFDDKLPDKKLDILEKLNAISSKKINTLSQSDLSSWFHDVTANATVDAFMSTMDDIYTNVLGDIGSPARTTAPVLRKMFETKTSKDNGYLYYPMGSYIVQFLNDEKKPYLKVLNILLNYGTYIHQFEVNLHAGSFDVYISSFSQSTFRFSYNGMSNAPANRPIGFIKSSASSAATDV